jgi:hypothetical protein
VANLRSSVDPLKKRPTAVSGGAVLGSVMRSIDPDVLDLELIFLAGRGNYRDGPGLQPV